MRGTFALLGESNIHLWGGITKYALPYRAAFATNAHVDGRAREMARPRQHRSDRLIRESPKTTLQLRKQEVIRLTGDPAKFYLKKVSEGYLVLDPFSLFGARGGARSWGDWSRVYAPNQSVFIATFTPATVCMLMSITPSDNNDRALLDLVEKGTMATENEELPKQSWNMLDGGAASVSPAA